MILRIKLSNPSPLLSDIGRSYTLSIVTLLYSLEDPISNHIRDTLHWKMLQLFSPI